MGRSGSRWRPRSGGGRAVGPKVVNRRRTAVGLVTRTVTLGRRRVPVKRPAGPDRRRRVGGAAGDLRLFADRYRLRDVVVERRPPASPPASIGKRAHEPVGEEIATGERSTSASTSAVSRAFAERTRQALSALMFHPLADPRRDAGSRWSQMAGGRLVTAYQAVSAGRVAIDRAATRQPVKVNGRRGLWLARANAPELPAPGLKPLLRDVKNPHCPDERAAAEDRALSKLMRLTRP